MSGQRIKQILADGGTVFGTFAHPFSSDARLIAAGVAHSLSALRGT